MPGNTAPIFSRVGEVNRGIVLTTAAADYNGQNINNAVAFHADPDNGSFVQRLRFKALGTNVATVVRIYINNGDGRLASSVSAVAGTPTGTPSASGGTLATGNYFMKVVAYDQYGAPTAASTETASVAVTGPTGSITWNWTAVTGAVKYRVYVGPVTGGQLTYFESTTNSYVQTAPLGVRDSLNGSSVNSTLFGEVSLPATTAATTSATVDVEVSLNFALPPAWRILVGLGTTVAAGWAVSAIGGHY